MLVHHKPTKILIVAMSGSGKTSYVLRYVESSKHKLKIIFDHKMEFYERLGLEPFFNRDEMLEAIIKGQRIVSYSHLEEFPGNAQGAFEWICEWTYEICRKLQIPTLFCCDEVNRFTDSTTKDWEFIQLIEDGRLWGLDFIGTAHGANGVHNKLRAQLTEIVAMRTDEPIPLEWLEQRGFDPNEVSLLAVGQFVLKDCLNKKFVRGRLFSIDGAREIEDEKDITSTKETENYEGNVNCSGSGNRGGGTSSDAERAVPGSDQHGEP